MTSYIPQPLRRMLGSSKFWTLALAVLSTYLGLDLSPELRALIMLVAATVFAGTTAWEDVAAKGSAGTFEMLLDEDED